MSRQPFRRQILAAAVLLLLPFLIAVLISGARTRSERRDEIRGEASSVATTAAAYLDEYLSSIKTLASTLQHHPAVIDLQKEAATELFSSLGREQPLLTNIVLADASGRIVASVLPVSDGLASRPWFQNVMTSGKAVVTEFSIGPLSSKPISTMAFPVQSTDGRTVGVLGFGIDLRSLQPVLARVPLPHGSVVTVVDQGSRVLVRTLEPERYVGTLQPATVSADADGASDWDDVDGVPRFHGNATLANAPWNVRVGIPQSEVQRRMQNLWFRNVAIASGGLLASMLLALLSTSLIARHTSQLRTAARQIAAGDLSAPMPTATIPSLELAELQSAFTTMVTNLRESKAALERQFEQERLMNDALQSLQRQVVRQERLAAVGLLASGLAHELNNPLQAIVGAAQLLERRSAPEQRPEIATISAQSARAASIIRSLARFGSHHPNVPAHVDLLEVVDEVTRLQSPVADRHSVTVFTHGTKPGRLVHASFAEIEQVVLNFVINAKHAVANLPAGEGRIELHLTDVTRWIRLEVHDNGPGVRPEDEPKLFQPFFTTKTVGDGTGLGLSVSYGIIHAYGGTIGYRRNQWGGATFFFELPCVEAQEAVTHDHSPLLRRPV